MVYFTPNGEELYQEQRKYRARFRRERIDFTNNVPSQKIDTFPVSGNRGLYGWTFRPSNGRINRREDLIGTLEGLITDVHENIHTPDERETRYIVAWMLEPLFKEKNKYKREIEYTR